MTAGTDGSFGVLKQVDAGVLSVGYAEAGPAAGPAVVLLHGWPYDIQSYAEVTPLLASAGYRVIVPYLRGYGTTPLPFRCYGEERNDHEKTENGHGSRDVRLFERDPTTSAYNIVTLIEALWLLDQVPACTRYLARDARRTLLKTLLEGLSGVDNKSGLVDLLVGEDRAQLQTLLGDGTPRLVADLVLSAVSREHGGFEPDVLFEWKPLLTRLVDEGLCQPRDQAQANSIESALDFMDDDHWPAIVRTRHGIDCRINRPTGNQTLLTFKLASPRDLFSDPRVTAAVYEWFRYFRPAHGEQIQLRCADDVPGANAWRIAIAVGAVAYAKWPGQSGMASNAEITPEALRLLLSHGHGMGAAFPDQPRAEAIPA